MDRNSCLAASQAQSQPGWPCGDAWMPEGTFRGVLGMVFQYRPLYPRGGPALAVVDKALPGWESWQGVQTSVAEA